MSTVPGKVGWPVVSDTSYSFYKNPTGYIHKHMTQHKSRLFKTRFLNTPTVFVGSNRGVQDVLTDAASSLDLGYRSFMYQVYGDNILFLNNEDSRELRQCLSHLFTTESIQNYQTKIDQITERHLENIDPSKPLCVYGMVKQLATEICLSIFLDLDFQQAADLAQRIQALTKTHWHGIISVPLPIKLPGSGNGTSFSKALEAKTSLLRIIQEKLGDKAGFVEALERLPFPQQTDIDNHLLLFTSALVPKAIASLLTSFLTATGHQDQVSCQDQLSSDLDLMNSVLLEVQRLYPPFIGGRRLVRKRCSVDGHSVEEGQAIVYLTHSAHRDPEVFTDPDKFLPQRWTGRNANDKSKLFCFGAGPRGCLGQDFVMKIVHCVLSSFVEKFRWQLLEGQDLTPKWLPVSRPRDTVMVQLTRRNS